MSPIVLQGRPPVGHWLAVKDYSARKRVLDLPGQFYPGDVLRVQRTGENIYVVRDYPRPLVARGFGPIPAQRIRKGDRIFLLEDAPQ